MCKIYVCERCQKEFKIKHEYKQHLKKNIPVLNIHHHNLQ